MHCGDNEKEFKIEIRQAAGHRSSENAPKNKRSWLLWCVVCHCECDSVHYIRSQSALSVFSPPSSVRTRVHSHGKKKCGTHDANRVLPARVRNMRNDTLEMYANTCSMFMRVCEVVCVRVYTKILSSSLGTCDTERHLMQPNDGGRRQRQRTHTFSH